MMHLVLPLLAPALAPPALTDPPAPPAPRGRQDGWEELALDLSEWRTRARERTIEPHLGRESLRLLGGITWLEGLELADGELEVDVALPAERGFIGVAFRVASPDAYEHFYLRPHESGQPDACQYTPVEHGLAGWQLFHGEGFGAPLDLASDRWTRVRVAFVGTRAEVYVDSQEPVVVVPELLRGAAGGSVGLVVADFAPAHFSRVRVRPGRPELEGAPPEPRRPAPGTFLRYDVSDPFDEARLAGVTDLAALPLLAERSWTVLPTESWGVANLARLAGSAPGADTVFARVVLRSDAERVVPLAFGYSDRACVFLNGRLLYRGDNGYRTRDFRYLGTIGLFDQVPLALRAGPNELLLAVSESFGGWGVLAALEPTPGVTRPPGPVPSTGGG